MQNPPSEIENFEHLSVRNRILTLRYVLTLISLFGLIAEVPGFIKRTKNCGKNYHRYKRC